MLNLVLNSLPEHLGATRKTFFSSLLEAPWPSVDLAGSRYHWAR